MDFSFVNELVDKQLQNIGGNSDMSRSKSKFIQTELDVKNQVNQTQNQTAVGFESLNEESDDAEDMVQEVMGETLMAKTERERKENGWDKGVRDGVVVGNEGEEKPMMRTLSEVTRIENEEQGNSQEGKSEEQIKKDEITKKRELNKLKKEARDRLKQLNSLDEWSFENTIEICRNKESCKFQTIASAEFLGNLLDRKIATYVGDLQRGWKHNSKNELIEVKSEKQIKLILDSLLHNRMHGGFITLNLNPSDGYEINYNEDDHTISGSINQKLQILDGNHRLNSFSRWVKLYKRNPESVPNPADYYIGVVIETLNDDDAKSLFSEYATKSLKISKSRGEFLNVEDYTNKLCRDIMKKSDIKVEVISTSISAKSENIISFGVFSKNIKDNYDPKSKSEVETLSNYLTMFIDSLIFTFPKFMASKDLAERAELRTHNLAMEALSWGGYLKLSTRLQGKTKDEILEVLNKFNDRVDYKGFRGNFLDKENPIFRKIMREGFKIINTSSSATWINKVFIGYVLDGKSLEEIGRED